MRTRIRKDATAARTRTGLTVVVTLAAGLAMTAGVARADGTNAAPATAPAVSAPSQHAAPSATTPGKPVSKTAAPKPAPNAMVMPKDAPKPGQTAPVAAAKPAVNAPAHVAPVAAVKPAVTAPAHVAPVAAVKPAVNAPAHVTPVAAVKPVPVTKPAAAPAGKPITSTQVLKTGAAAGSVIATASHGTDVKVTRMVASPSARPTSGVGSARATQPAAQLDEHVTYQYNTLGRRDPFQSYIDGSFVGEDVGGDAPIDVGGMKVVGVVWGETDRFAMVEDGRGGSHVLRRGDKVMNGFVEDLQKDGVVVNLTADGQSQSVTIPLIRKGEKNASR